MQHKAATTSSAPHDLMARLRHIHMQKHPAQKSISIQQHVYIHNTLNAEPCFAIASAQHHATSARACADTLPCQSTYCKHARQGDEWLTWISVAEMGQSKLAALLTLKGMTKLNMRSLRLRA